MPKGFPIGFEMAEKNGNKQTDRLVSSTEKPAGGPWDTDRMAKGSVAQKRLGTTDLKNYDW